MGRLWLFGAALLFSTGGAAIKGNSLTAWQVASFRSLIAAIMLSLLFPASRGHWSRRHILLGLCYAATLITFVASNRLTTSANAIFLQATAPAYLVVLSPLLLHERLRRSDFLLLGGCAAGMLLFFMAAEAPRATAPNPSLGNIVALISGFLWALVMLSMRAMARDSDGDGAGTSMSMVITGNWLTFLIALPAALPLPIYRMHDLLAVLWLGIFQVGFAYVCLTRALQRLPAFEAATLLLIEPAMNPVWTWLTLGEKPAPLAVAGGAMIVGTTLLNAWWNSTRR
ncbi:MAG TPA: DMT family transporter [Bryobacteraceae bacterium]|nr:DMT family transporter [Bryobacteraceae bacterium]